MMRKNMINMTEEAITADPKGFAKSMVAAKRATTALRILYDFLDCGSVPQSERIVDIIFDVKLAAKKKGFDISDERGDRWHHRRWLCHLNWSRCCLALTDLFGLLGDFLQNHVFLFVKRGDGDRHHTKIFSQFHF